MSRAHNGIQIHKNIHELFFIRANEFTTIGPEGTITGDFATDSTLMMRVVGVL